MRWFGMNMSEEEDTLVKWMRRRLKEKVTRRGVPGSLGVDNIRMDLQEVGCGYMDWIGQAQDRDRWRTLVSAVMNLRVP